MTTAKLRLAILELDRLWGSTVLGLALCDDGPKTVQQLAEMTQTTTATTRRRL